LVESTLSNSNILFPINVSWFYLVNLFFPPGKSPEQRYNVVFDYFSVNPEPKLLKKKTGFPYYFL